MDRGAFWFMSLNASPNKDYVENSRKNVIIPIVRQNNIDKWLSVYFTTNEETLRSFKNGRRYLLRNFKDINEICVNISVN
jgi:hypothetical protein